MREPNATLKIEGKSFKELGLWKGCGRVTFSEGLDKISSLMIELTDVNDKTLAKEIFKHGADVEFAIGYGQFPYTPMFEGLIKTIEPQFPNSGVPTLSVEAFDYSILLMKKREETESPKPKQPSLWETFVSLFREEEKKEEPRSVMNMSIGAICRAVMNDYPRIKKMDVDESDFKLPKDEQIFDDYQMTDRDLLRKLAKWCGYYFWISRDTIHFKKISHEAQGKPLIYRSLPDEECIPLKSLSPRTNIMDIARSMKVVSQRTVRLKDVIGEGVDVSKPMGKKHVQEIILEVWGERVRMFIDRLPSDEEQAKKLLAAKAEEEALRFVTGYGALKAGDPTLRMGQVRTIMLRGLPELDDAFSGDYLITETTHELGDSGYDTQFVVKRNALNY